jgi:transposase
MKNTKSTTPAVYVGLDVHKSSIVVAYALADGSTPVIHGKLGGSNLALERGLLKLRKKLGVDKAALRVCYEAGPTGFVAARRLLELGYDTIIVAPSKIQRAPGERVKTDRKDAVKLARLHRSGDLEGIHIPAPDDEAIRDVCRARTDASDDRRKAKQRLGAFLLRNGIHYTGKSKWTAAHMRYLRDLKLPSDTQQIVLEEYLQAIDSAHERTERLADRLETLLLTWDRADYVLALMAMRGFKLVAAMTVIAELGDLSRFRHPRQLMAYLGLVPGERSTGTRRRQGGITKCGNGHARWMLVECATHYRRRPKVNAALSYRQDGQSQEVKKLSWRAQNRLFDRHVKLGMRKLHHNKTTIAVARELSAFIWELCAIVDAEKAAAAATVAPAK